MLFFKQPIITRRELFKRISIAKMLAALAECKRSLTQRKLLIKLDGLCNGTQQINHVAEQGNVFADIT